tara:strand:- start:862 stop:1191 length:330 start_codon:yes stop_codon:yes gene_type:complete
MAKIEEKSGVSFSLSFLIQMLSGIILFVWIYSQLDSRLSTAETSSVNNTMHIEKIQTDMMANQDSPISADFKQFEQLNSLRHQLEIHKEEIINLRDKLYVLNRIVSLRR